MIFLSSTVLDQFLADRSWNTWTPTWSAPIGSGGSVTLHTARYQYFGNEIYYVVRATLTSIGTWGGDLRFTLPFSPLRNFGCIARNLSTGAILQHISSSLGVGVTWTATNGFPLASGHILGVQGRYTWK